MVVLLTIADVMRKLGGTATPRRVATLVEQGKLPKPIAIGKRSRTESSRTYGMLRWHPDAIDRALLALHESAQSGPSEEPPVKPEACPNCRAKRKR